MIPAPVEAVRFVALAAEDGALSREAVRAVFHAFCTHADAAVRIAVVEAVWLLGDRDSRLLLVDMLGRETVDEVKASLEHVIGLMS